MYKNPFEQLEDSRTILLAYAAQLTGGQAKRVMCEPEVLGSFLTVIAHTIENALEAYEESTAPLLDMPQAVPTMAVHEAAPKYE